MSGLPLPSRLAGHLALRREEAGPGTSLSLLYDRGFIGDSDREDVKAKQVFLENFRQVFAGGDLSGFVRRRRRAMEALGATCVDLVNHTRLVVGLGLPSPLETGFLLDRLTGCPYLPGSSVKGLARATAGLVAAGELEGDRDYWKDHQERIFGPPLGEGATPRKGHVIFYDAFPSGWPKLTVDVLTPHYKDYYGGDDVPGDWGDPVPIPFLTVEVGTEMAFHLRTLDAEADVDKLRAILELGLEELGIGGKRSSGYGVFSSAPAPESPAPVTSRARTSRRQEEAPPPSKTGGESLWTGARLERGRGGIETWRKKTRAEGARNLVDSKTWTALKKRKEIRADVRVVKVMGDYRIVKVENVKLPS